MAGKKIPIERRLRENTLPQGDCLIWRGKLYRGYPRMGFGHGKTKRGNRAVWEHFRGPIPDGFMVCHTCDEPRCLNIAHLFLGTAKDNAGDMVRKGRHHEQTVTHCPHGHPYVPANTYVKKLRSGRFQRHCRECAMRRCKEYYRRTKGIAA